MSRLWYDFLHNCVAHPLGFFTRGAAWTEKFHAWTADRAWPIAHKLRAGEAHAQSQGWLWRVFSYDQTGGASFTTK